MRGRYAALAAVGVLAGLYFAEAIGGTLEWLDEGMIVYPSWRTAQGALPYADFGHLYGPSLFFLNGGLMRLFGPDLRVVRLGLVVVKACVAVEIYVLARALAPAWIAATMSALVVAVWGTPIWLFNTPYATYYTTAAALAGFILLGGQARAGLRGVLAAGLAIGIAITFKQTQGLLAAVGAALLLMVEGAGAPATDARALRVALLAIPLGGLGFGAVVLGPHLATPTAAVLLAPLAAACAVVARRTLRRTTDVRRVAGRLLVLIVGTAIPLAGYVALYAAHGHVGDLVFDTAFGLPQRISCFLPFSLPGVRTALFAGIVAGSFVLASVAQRGRRRAFVWTLVAVAIVAAGWVGAAMAGPVPLRLLILDGRWTDDFYVATPVLVVVGMIVAGWMLERSAAPPRAGTRAFLIAAVSTPLLYPYADLLHFLMVLPLFVPVVAFVLASVVGRRGSRVGRGVVLAVAVAWPCAAMVPFVRHWEAGRHPGPSVTTFARASGIQVPGPEAAGAGPLVRDLAARQAPVFVVPNEQMVYFLAGVHSALERDEFTLYLVAADLMSAENARAVADEDRMIATLDASHAIVVDLADDPASARVRHAFPRLAAFIERAYAPPRKIGGYEVRLPAVATTSSSEFPGGRSPSVLPAK